MRVHEAMRLGAMLDGQAFYQLQDRDGNTCAMGAALKAATGKATWTDKALAFSAWMVREPAVCPACTFTDDVMNTVVHLNNHHHWTREQIADWLQPIEEARCPPEPVAVKEEELCLV